MEISSLLLENENGREMTTSRPTNASNVTMRRLCFTVPESTMREKVTADYRNGILTVHLPKDPAGQIGSVKIDFPL